MKGMPQRPRAPGAAPTSGGAGSGGGGGVVMPGRWCGRRRYVGMIAEIMHQLCHKALRVAPLCRPCLKNKSLIVFSFEAVEHARGARLIDCVLARFMDHDGGSDPLHVCSQDGAPVVLVFAPVDLSRGGSCDVSWLFVLIPVSGNGCSL